MRSARTADASIQPATQPTESADLLIVCEIRLYREGLRDALALRSAFPAMMLASTSEEALRAARAAAPALVLLDMSVGGAAELVHALLDLRPAMKIIALGINEDSPAVLDCVELGACAYVTRDATLEELASVVEAAVRGEATCPPRVTASLFRRIATLARERPKDVDLKALTEREHEILGLIGQGLSNKEIARRLKLQLATVKNHVHHILEKLGVSGRGAAAAVARHTSPR
jgi:DNA-binding NarL/FixJ family response regulator